MVGLLERIEVLDNIHVFIESPVCEFFAMSCLVARRVIPSAIKSFVYLIN